MKTYIQEFVRRGLCCAAGGPIVLAVIYGILGNLGTVNSLAPGEVCLGILSVTLIAFVAAGITMIYQVEQLPLISAILIHGGVLYLDYLLMYLLNNWLPRNWAGLGLFTLIFVAGYAATWLCIYLTIRAKTQRLNRKLRK